MDWCHPHTYCHNSSIHGEGNFAKKDIVKNSIVFIFGGAPFFQNQKELQEKSLQERVLFDRHVLHLTGSFYLKADKSPYMPVNSRLINHSCDPNLIIEGHIVVRAYRDIFSGEELCLDYGTITHSEDTRERIVIEKCLCQTSSCRQKITAQDWKQVSLQKKYGTHFTFDLLKKMGKVKV